MFNPVLSPELVLMLKRGEIERAEEAHDDELLRIECMEFTSSLDPELLIDLAADAQEDAMRFSDHLTVQDEPLDLASEIEPTIWDKYLPNDGTPAIERRLRKQGFKKADDTTREEVQEAWVEVGIIANRRMGRMHVLRQKGGDLTLI